jgi:hypothetical protein
MDWTRFLYALGAGVVFTGVVTVVLRGLRPGPGKDRGRR